MGISIQSNLENGDFFLNSKHSFLYNKLTVARGSMVPNIDEQMRPFSHDLPRHDTTRRVAHKLWLQIFEDF